jgi:hypothetical protein
MVRRLTLRYALTAMATAGNTICFINLCGDERGTVLGMKTLRYLTKASIETARLMVMAAPEDVNVEAIYSAISEASKEAEWLEIAAIDHEAALEDSKS